MSQNLLQQQQIYNMLFPEFRATSRVWVYTSNRSLTPDEQVVIQKEIDLFISSWAAHGDELYGAGIIHDDRFVVLAVDEAAISASGCSIDTSVKFIKELGENFNVDFFDRLNLVIEKNNEFDRVHISDLKDYSDWNVYNPMVSNLQELRENWKVLVSASPFV